MPNSIKRNQKAYISHKIKINSYSLNTHFWVFDKGISAMPCQPKYFMLSPKKLELNCPALRTVQLIYNAVY
jgi:hypothetical protein